MPEYLDPIDPDVLEAAAARFEAWLAFAGTNQPGKDRLHDVSYEGFPIGDADLRLLLADYRHHRPPAAVPTRQGHADGPES